MPCGSGEEAYSIAILLFEAGLTESEIHIDGIDISRRALQRADSATYGQRSFRETSSVAMDLQQRYFERQQDSWLPIAPVRQVVYFQWGNLVDRQFLHLQSDYDVIFCRNLLIYLDNTARTLALTNLHRLLTLQGVLYVGHAEGRVSGDPRFRTMGPQYPFALVRADNPKIGRDNTGVDRGGPSPRAAQRSVGQQAMSTSRPPVRSRRPRPPADRNVQMPAAVPTTVASSPQEPDLLAEAKVAANRGTLEEAARLCQACLDQQGPSAAAFCLLGVVRQAQGAFDLAEHCFGRALYLMPSHHESLVHMSLLLARRGDSAGAANYRRRAERQTQEEE